MRDTALWTEWDIRHVATHCDGTKLKRLGIFIVGSARFIVQLLIKRPDIIHLHTSERGSFVRKGLLTWVSAIFRIPVLLHMHGGEFHEYFANQSRPLQWLIRATLERTDVVIALGNVWAQRLQDVAPKAHIEVVPNAIRANVKVDQISAKEVQVVFLGELCERKGTSVLLDAWAGMIAARDVKPAKLTIGGWGEIDRANNQIRSLGIGDTVHIAGWLSATEVQQLLARTHVLALPSLNEGQPMVILEAMARGICVVSTTAGGIPEMLDESEGVLVAPGSVSEFSCALAKVINDAEARGRFGSHARNRVEREFNVDAVSRRFDELYRTVLTDRRRRRGSAPENSAKVVDP
ncbi:glycosyltransferase family 4 protein [Mycolicibacterium stellerae]|uniref:glycosyltransferase family 4 protein n=1 Tax=Mycolicibacterium stellerae TaxID=2358193 RepID=UPI000F0B93D9|nr:glycosyltransferase family 4 protein [Mycolicibacterium stellerae]